MDATQLEAFLHHFEAFLQTRAGSISVRQIYATNRQYILPERYCQSFPGIDLGLDLLFKGIPLHHKTQTQLNSKKNGGRGAISLMLKIEHDICHFTLLLQTKRDLLAKFWALSARIGALLGLPGGKMLRRHLMSEIASFCALRDTGGYPVFAEDSANLGEATDIWALGRRLRVQVKSLRRPKSLSVLLVNSEEDPILDPQLPDLAHFSHLIKPYMVFRNKLRSFYPRVPGMFIVAGYGHYDPYTGHPSPELRCKIGQRLAMVESLLS